MPPWVGVGSILKSPVCTTVPTPHLMAKAQAAAYAYLLEQGGAPLAELSEKFGRTAAGGLIARGAAKVEKERVGRSPYAAVGAQPGGALPGAADPAASLALAKPLRTPEASPEDSDAAFLLLEDAAQKGNAEAMWLVGQFYDPAAGLPRGSIPADMSLARQWYEKAKAAGVTQAEAALKALRAHVEAAAAKGDMEAKMLLQSWK